MSLDHGALIIKPMCIKKWIFKIYDFIFDPLVFINEHGISLYAGPQEMLVNVRLKC